MKCWILCVLVASGMSEYLKFGVSASNHFQSLHRRQLSEQSEHILQRRGGQKQSQKGNSKNGGQGKSNTSASKSQGSSDALEAGNSRMPDSSKSGSKTKSEALESARAAILMPAPPPRPPFSLPQDTASSSQSSRGRRTKGQSQSRSIAPPVRAPFTPAQDTATSSQSSKGKQTQDQTVSKPVAAQPWDSFLLPQNTALSPQPPQGKQKKGQALSESVVPPLWAPFMLPQETASSSQPAREKQTRAQGKSSAPVSSSKAPSTSQHDTASSSNPARGKQAKAQGKTLASASSPQGPATPPLRRPVFSPESSRGRQAEDQTMSMPATPPPRLAFTSAMHEAGPSSSQPSRGRRSRGQAPSMPPAPSSGVPSTSAAQEAGPSSSRTSQARRTRTQRQRSGIKDDSSTESRAEMTKLRVMQHSGATGAGPTAETVVRPPSEGMPRQIQQPAQQRVLSPPPLAQQPTQQHSSTQLSETQRQWGSAPLPDQPSGVQPIVTYNIPAAQGIRWLGDQSKIVNDWKQKAQAQAQQGTTPPPLDEGIKKILTDSVQQVEKDQGKAQVMRKVDDANFEAARIAMRQGNTPDSRVRIAVQASKDATRQAQAYTFAASHAESSIAQALAKHEQWAPAVRHLQKEHTAFARQELRMQRGQAFDFHYVNKGVKEGFARIAARKGTPASGTIQKAVAVRKQYRTAAEGYRQQFKDYYTVRDAMDASSSDESATSLFDDVLPPESPTAASASATAAASGTRSRRSGGSAGSAGSAGSPGSSPPRSEGSRDASPEPQPQPQQTRSRSRPRSRSGSAASGSPRAADLPP